MNLPTNPYAYLIGAGVIAWVYKLVRDAQIYRRFIRSIATNHLPHIYDAQKQMAQGINRLLDNSKLESIVLDDPPTIEFIDFDKGK